MVPFTPQNNFDSPQRPPGPLGIGLTDINAGVAGSSRGRVWSYPSGGCPATAVEESSGLWPSPLSAEDLAFEVDRLRRELGRARQRADWYARACEGQKGEIEALRGLLDASRVPPAGPTPISRARLRPRNNQPDYTVVVEDIVEEDPSTISMSDGIHWLEQNINSLTYSNLGTVPYSIPSARVA